MSEDLNKVLTVKEWAAEDRPREKLQDKGRSALSNAELLAIIIGSGFKSKTAVDVAKDLLAAYDNSLDKLAQVEYKKLTKIKGIGPAKAIGIVAAMELSRRRILLLQEVGQEKEPDKITSSQASYQAFYAKLGDLDHEEFHIAILNQSNQIIKIQRISEGGINATVVDPRKVFRIVLEHPRACGVILAHNHPSGSITPSKADVDITNKLFRAGVELDLRVLDHIIIGSGKYFSFADEGKMPS